MGIQFGLPYVYYPDEAIIVNHAMGFGTGDLNPHYFIYPSLLMYLMFVIYGSFFAIGLLFGVFRSTDDFVRLFFADATAFYLPGRLLSAFSGVASVWVVYKVADRAYNRSSGLVAAAFLSVSVLHVTFSHYLKTHVPAGFLVTLALWLALSICRGDDRWRRYVGAGLMAGLAASTIYHAGFVLVSVLSAHFLREAPNQRSVRDSLASWKKPLAAIVSSIVAFGLTTPFAILDWTTFLNDLTGTARLFHAGGFWQSSYFHPFTSLIMGFGQPLGVIALLGLGRALLRRRATDLILASQPLFLGLFFMLFRAHQADHMLIAYPALSILGAVLVVEVVSVLVGRVPDLRTPVLAVVAGLMVLAPAAGSARMGYRHSLPDTRTVAKAWLELNIPEEAKILVDSGKYYLGAFSPPLELSRWTLQQLVERSERARPGPLTAREGTRRASYAGEAAYFRAQLRVCGDCRGFDVVPLVHTIGASDPTVLSLDEYRAQGVQYAVVSSYAWTRYSRGGDGAGEYPETVSRRFQDLYEALKTRGTLLMEIRESDAIVGPTIRIYKLP